MARTDTQSRWRREARQVIAATLEALPHGERATPAQRRKAVRDAYPFGDRRGWPYKCWCLEVRLALGEKPRPPEPAPTVRIVLGSRSERTPWLFVLCGWCDNRHEYVSRTGDGYNPVPECVPCIMCANADARVKDTVSRPEWRSLQRAVREGGCPRAVLADWLRDVWPEWEDDDDA